MTEFKVNTPTTTAGATPKSYVDSVAQGLSVKPSCVAIATTNVSTLSGTATTVDGVALNTVGMRVLLAGQSTPTQNGIYVVQTIAWTRAADMDVASDAAGAFTFIEQGTVNAESGWVCSNSSPALVGVASLAFTQFSGAGEIIAGNGLAKSGNTLSVVAADASIVSNGSGVSVGTISDGQHGSRAGGTLHANVVAAGAAGFMTGSDKTKLDGLPSSAVPTSRTLTAGTGLSGGGDLSANRSFAMQSPSGGDLATDWPATIVTQLTGATGVVKALAAIKGNGLASPFSVHGYLVVTLANANHSVNASDSANTVFLIQGTTNAVFTVTLGCAPAANGPIKYFYNSTANGGLVRQSLSVAYLTGGTVSISPGYVGAVSTDGTDAVLLWQVPVETADYTTGTDGIVPNTLSPIPISLTITATGAGESAEFTYDNTGNPITFPTINTTYDVIANFTLQATIGGTVSAVRLTIRDLAWVDGAGNYANLGRPKISLSGNNLDWTYTVDDSPTDHFSILITSGADATTIQGYGDIVAIPMGVV